MGDQVSEICDICGSEVSEFVEINGLIICKSCQENFELKKEEMSNSERCIICNWPINRKISKENVEKFLNGILKWIENHKPEVKEKLLEKVSFLRGDDLPICRYDFFEIIKKFITDIDEDLGRKFESEISRNYDFSGSLIS